MSEFDQFEDNMDRDERLVARIDELERELAAYHWIPVSERLPVARERVLVPGGIAYWMDPRPEFPDGVWFSITGIESPGRPIQWNVTHWMPLPEAPK